MSDGNRRTMTMAPRITLITPSYNQAQYGKETDLSAPGRSFPQGGGRVVVRGHMESGGASG